MPIYDYACSQCDNRNTDFRKIDQRNDPFNCKSCGGEMQLCISPVRGNQDIDPYRSMVTGEMVSSRTRHREILREHNLVEVGNETHYLKSKPITTPPGLKETLIRQVKKHRGY
jgi:putative FmdB family regulatory protein